MGAQAYQLLKLIGREAMGSGRPCAAAAGSGWQQAEHTQGTYGMTKLQHRQPNTTASYFSSSSPAQQVAEVAVLRHGEGACGGAHSSIQNQVGQRGAAAACRVEQ